MQPQALLLQNSINPSNTVMPEIFLEMERSSAGITKLLAPLSIWFL